ncbi:MAG TPA: Ig-like domain-containing protein [Chthoniobacterales bacterium]
MPPRVTRTIPPDGAQQLDPARTTAIVITFDQPMGVKKHGLHVFENDKPVDISKLAFAYSPDGKTFTLPYNVRPGTRYRLELNSVTDIGFSRATRVPLWPVQISFSTQ